jgi:hypothetical protein
MTRKKDPNSISGKIRAAIANNPKLRNKLLAKDLGTTSSFVSAIRGQMRRQIIKDINAFPYVPKPELPVVPAMAMKMAIDMVATEEEEEAFQALANAQQVGGSHYKSKAIQPWDYIASNQLGYLEGNVVKYVSRWKDKGGLEDLKKAQHYLTKLIEVNQ